MDDQQIVYVVDDDPAVVDSLTELIRSMQLRAECFASADEFLSAIDPDVPGCLVVDVRMPGMSGIELQDKLAADRIPLPVIIVTGHGDVPMSVRAIKKGAVNFLEKPYRTEELADSIRAALKVNVKLRREEAARASLESRFAAITPDEAAVVKCIVEGKPNKIIASELDISLRTVQFRLSSILKKLEVDSRAALVKLVVSTRQTFGNE